MPNKITDINEFRSKRANKALALDTDAINVYLTSPSDDLADDIEAVLSSMFEEIAEALEHDSRVVMPTLEAKLEHALHLLVEAGTLISDNNDMLGEYAAIDVISSQLSDLIQHLNDDL